MEEKHLEQLTTLRAVVGYLGEQAESPWWGSSFFSSASKAFVVGMFPRSLFLARFHGVCRAAMLVHDEHIGVGSVQHLFRLSEDLEQAIHHLAQSSTFSEQCEALITDKQSALDSLLRHIGEDGLQSVQTSAQGPVRVGDVAMVRGSSACSELCTYYAGAFRANAPAYPYFYQTA